MTNSVTHVIPKIARICGYGITALTVAFLLEMVFEIMLRISVKRSNITESITYQALTHIWRYVMARRTLVL